MWFPCDAWSALRHDALNKEMTDLGVLQKRQNFLLISTVYRQVRIQNAYWPKYRPLQKSFQFLLSRIFKELGKVVYRRSFPRRNFSRQIGKACECRVFALASRLRGPPATQIPVETKQFVGRFSLSASRQKKFVGRLEAPTRVDAQLWLRRPQDLHEPGFDP
jgi:hypothetical protein